MSCLSYALFIARYKNLDIKIIIQIITIKAEASKTAKYIFYYTSIYHTNKKYSSISDFNLIYFFFFT
jgi:hypothetical protein